MAKRTIKISIKLPAGITSSKELEDKAAKAANDAVTNALSDLVETQKLAKKLASQGIQISAEELMSRKVERVGKVEKVERVERVGKVGKVERAGKAGKVGSSGRKVAAKKTGARKRVVLSDAERKKMAADLDADMKIKEAAKKYGVSSATVMNVKTKAGLTNKRK